MSSAVYLEFKEPIALSAWKLFCKKEQIKYSPRTVGRNVFYAGAMEIEIHFGERDYTDLPKLLIGAPDFSKATPFDAANKITVSTFYMGNVEGVAKVAKAILRKWPHGTYTCDPELKDLMR